MTLRPRSHSWDRGPWRLCQIGVLEHTGKGPQMAIVRKRASGEFTQRSIFERAIEIAEPIIGEPGQLPWSDREIDSSGCGYLDTSFRGPVPDEILTATEGRADLRMRFAGNRPDGMGEDCIWVIGADEMVSRVAQAYTARVERARAEIRRGGSALAPDAEFVEALADIGGARSVDEWALDDVIEHPYTLSNGSTFNWHGALWVVVRDAAALERGFSDCPRAHCVSDGGSFNLDGVMAIPCDAGSLTRPEHVEPEPAAAPARRRTTRRRLCGWSTETGTTRHKKNPREWIAYFPPRRLPTDEYRRILRRVKDINGWAKFPTGFAVWKKDESRFLEIITGP